MIILIIFLTAYITIGLFILIADSLDWIMITTGDWIGWVFGWWLMPLIILINKIRG